MAVAFESGVPFSLFILVKFFLFFLLLATSLTATEGTSSVVAPAPDFSWKQEGRETHLSSLRGKPVLLILARTPNTRALRSQLRELRGSYEKLAAQGMVACVAWTEKEGRIPSNIPFITALHGAAIAEAYGVQKSFAVAVIGADGNLDCLSMHPLPGARIHDLIDASYTVQTLLRRE